ncbi:hypothetical protein FHS93_001108 [Sphingobium francense]|nr:hypothetical protein [Sphingobium indicum]
MKVSLLSPLPFKGGAGGGCAAPAAPATVVLQAPTHPNPSLEREGL